MSSCVNAITKKYIELLFFLSSNRLKTEDISSQFFFMNSWEFSKIASIKITNNEPFGPSFRPPFFSIDVAHTRWLPSHC